MKIGVYLLIICSLLATGCQKKSGNIWDDNQTTGSKYQDESNVSLLWENNGVPPGPTSDAFLPLNDSDLRRQFTEIPLPINNRELGDIGMPTADQFEIPRGELASIFTPIFFDTDEHVVSSKEYLQVIHRAAIYLKTHPKVYVIIEGHCDERAGEAYNLALGTRRANYVRSLLLKAGARIDQIHAVSLGKEHPFALGHNQEAWKQNRRAHFRVHSEGGQ
jgi:peptidoglycan-associated lipoprotein